MARIARKTYPSFVFLHALSLAVLCASSAHPAYDDAPTFGVAVSTADREVELVAVRREEYDGGRIIDISHYYREDMPAWESAEGVGQFLRLLKSMDNGSLANNSEMMLPTHTGTHVDAPGHVFQHYFEAGFDVDTLDLEVLNGPALLVDVPRDKNITAEAMESLHIPRGVRRVLFRTLNTDRQLMWKKEFDTSYVGFMKDGALHKTVERVVMCDIDEEVVDFCRSHLVANKEAFFNSRLKLVINDARAELVKREERFDVIIGDLADPIEDGPCYQLYTKSFYESILKPRLKEDGIFVTQAGPAGVFSHTEVFSCIYNTLRHVFKYVVPYSAHIPSYADTWGWIMASDSPFTLDSDELDSRIRQRINGENRYLDGKTFASASLLSKAVRKSLAKETQVYTEGTAKFIYGHGTCHKIHSGLQ